MCLGLEFFWILKDWMEDRGG
jgi:hypothetical protein